MFRSVSDSEVKDKKFNFAKLWQTKKGLIIAATVVVALMILVCILLIKGNADNKNKDLGVFSKEKGVPAEQFKADIVELTYIKNGIIKNNTAGDYRVNKISVDKRQTNIEQKNDIIYCIVNISNELYESDVYVKLIYNLYNGDIWSLDEDEYITDQCASKPLKCVEIPITPVNDVYISMGVHEMDIENIQHIKDDKLMPCNVDYYTYKQTSHYKLMSVEGIFGADVCIDYYFSPINGWCQITLDDFKYDYEVENVYCLDYGEIFGKFQKNTLKIGYYQEYLELYNYDAANDTISYTYTDKYNKKFTGSGVFDLLNMSIKSEEYMFSYDTEFKYWCIGDGFWSNYLDGYSKIK